MMMQPGMQPGMMGQPGEQQGMMQPSADPSKENPGNI